MRGKRMVGKIGPERHFRKKVPSLTGIGRRVFASKAKHYSHFPIPGKPGSPQLKRAMDAYLDYFEGATASLEGLSAEMIYWERPQGGRVFNAGAVGASWVLGVDEAFSLLLRNVLHHFGVTPT